MAADKSFSVTYGAVKLLLVGGLAFNKRWSYPAAILVFAVFTDYQAYEFAHRSSLFTGAITVLDGAVVALIAAEYGDQLKAGGRSFEWRDPPGPRGKWQ